MSRHEWLCKRCLRRSVVGTVQAFGKILVTCVPENPREAGFRRCNICGKTADVLVQSVRGDRDVGLAIDGDFDEVLEG